MQFLSNIQQRNQDPRLIFIGILKYQDLYTTENAPECPQT